MTTEPIPHLEDAMSLVVHVNELHVPVGDGIRPLIMSELNDALGMERSTGGEDGDDGNSSGLCHF